jgi:sulfonate dioxygenase
MAPALVETPTQVAVRVREAIGLPEGYKEAYIGGPKVYQKEVEEKGNSAQPAAKYPNYLPTWDGNKSRTPFLRCCRSFES